MAIINCGPCYRCEGIDHWAEHCPELEPATRKGDHDARIEKYKEWWITHRIDTRQKRDLITAESDRWTQLQATKGKAA